MHIAVNRTLEVANVWSMHRTLEVKLMDLPADPPRADLINLAFEALSRLELPPRLALRLTPVESADLSNLSSAGPFGWAELAGSIAVELQCAVGQPRLRSYISDATGPEQRIALECLEFTVAAAVLAAAAKLLTQLHVTGNCDAGEALAAVRTVDEQDSLGDATGPIVAAARRRGIPTLRLDRESRVQFGEGAYARQIRKAATDATGMLAELASSDKAYTKALWSRLGIPVPAGRVVADVEDAVRVAEELGWPVVVKPLDSDYSNGVTLNVVDERGVRAGFAFARTESESVLIEHSLSGAVHRFLVVGDRVISAVRRDPAGVTGDGRRTIRELVEAENQSPERGPDERWPLHRLKLEQAELSYLAEQGMDGMSRPRAGQRVELRREPYLTAGGETHEVLDRVHPSTLAAVCDAVKVIGLDVAGVDLIAGDISRPLIEQGGGLLELNAQPAICLHRAPFNDNPQPVGEIIVENLFPGGATGRIPLTVVLGEYSNPVELQPLAQAMSANGQTGAISTEEVTRIEGRQLTPLSGRPADRLAAMSLHPRTTAGCLCATATSLLQHGLGTDQCDLLVLADADRAAECEHRSNADLEHLLSRLVAMAENSLVNLDNGDWGALATSNIPSIILASADENHPALIRHLHAGNRIIVREKRHVVLRSAMKVIARKQLPASAANPSNEWLVTAAALLIEQRRRRRHSRIIKTKDPRSDCSVSRVLRRKGTQNIRSRQFE